MTSSLFLVVIFSLYFTKFVDNPSVKANDEPEDNNEEDNQDLQFKIDQINKELQEESDYQEIKNEKDLISNHNDDEEDNESLDFSKPNESK